MAPCVPRRRALWLLVVALHGAAAGEAALPQGDAGIAARHPGDVGIAADPAVVWADGFESYGSVADLWGPWTNLYQQVDLRIATEAANVHAGGKSIEMRIPAQTQPLSDGLEKAISPARDTLFVRAYTKFDAGFDVSGSEHNGLTISAHYCCPGVPADGTDKFLVDVENSREGTTETTPGRTNAYVYWPDQRDVYGDHWYPDGTISPFTATPGDSGPDFVARPDFTPQLGRWYCYELMVKANTPGSRDGRVAIWIDGALIADWQNVRLRDTTALMIDQVSLGLYIGTNPNRQNVKWYDDVVIATSYIGPMTSGGSTSGTTSGGSTSGGTTGSGSASGSSSGGHRGCGRGGAVAAAALAVGLLAAAVGLRRRG